jgi:hypothetical protein
MHGALLALLQHEHVCMPCCSLHTGCAIACDELHPQQQLDVLFRVDAATSPDASLAYFQRSQQLRVQPTCWLPSGLLNASAFL